MRIPTGLSANALFHFTGTYDALCSVLEHGVWPRYSKEILPIEAEEFIGGIPMACFCDIPLSRTRRHRDVYGRFAIGLTKTWGVSRGVSPVLYGSQGSPVTESLYRIMARGLGVNSGGRYADRIDPTVWIDAFRLSCFVKPYTGHFERRGRPFKDYLYYDEREWRFVPDVVEEELRFGLDESQFNKPAELEKANELLRQRYALTFTPEDIRYLLVPSDTQAGDLVAHIESAPQYSETQRRLLYTRIVRFDDIAADF